MRIVVLIAALLLCITAIPAQEKGIDTQTSTIKKKNQPNSRENDVSRSFDWGRGKTKVRERYPNPMRVPSRRDVLVRTISTVLTDLKFVVDETASQFDKGLVVTQPKVFARGAILTKNELFRYAVVPRTDQVWTRGRFTLTIDVLSIDGIKNDVSVIATVEGRSENGIFSEWSTLESSGQAEEEFLAKLVEFIGGDTKPSQRKP